MVSGFAVWVSVGCMRCFFIFPLLFQAPLPMLERPPAHPHNFNARADNARRFAPWGLRLLHCLRGLSILVAICRLCIMFKGKLTGRILLAEAVVYCRRIYSINSPALICKYQHNLQIRPASIRWKSPRQYLLKLERGMSRSLQIWFLEMPRSAKICSIFNDSLP